jgi:hypothetical protein
VASIEKDQGRTSTCGVMCGQSVFFTPPFPCSLRESCVFLARTNSGTPAVSVHHCSLVTREVGRVAGFAGGIFTLFITQRQ